MYDRLLDMNNLHSAYKKCKSGVDWKASVQRYGANELHNLMILRKSLLNESYKQKQFYEFDICERGKNRHIKSLHISDRVLQRALSDDILMPVIKDKLIYDNGASVKGKGIEFTRERLKAHLEKYYRRYGNKGYVLLIDFSKFFDSIPHNKLLESLSEIIPDKKVMKIINHVIEVFDPINHVGVGIGSQISQVAGIYYPTRIDNYIKIVKSCKYYGRYMDDLYVIHNNKEFLKNLLNDIDKIATDLGLKLNQKKTQICRIDKGFNFLKLRHILTDSGRVVRTPARESITRERKKLTKLHKKYLSGDVGLDDIQKAYKSWRGNILKYDSYKSVKNMDNHFKCLFGECVL